MPAKAAPAKKAAPKAAAPVAKAAAPAAKKAAAPVASGNGVYVSKWGQHNAEAAKAAFAACGVISSVQIRRNKYALIFFENAAGAKKAIDTLNNKVVLGNVVTVTAAKTSPKKDAEGSSVVFVGPYFPESTPRKNLIELFKASGKILKVRTYANHTAFIYFDNAASAAKAVKDVNGKVLSQKTLVVKPSVRTLAKDKSKREHALTMIKVHNWKIAKTGHK